MFKLFLGLVISVASFASYSSIIIDDSSTKIRHFNIEYFYDASQDMRIDDIVGKSFFKEIPSQFSLGYKEGNAWFKVEIINKSKNKNFIIELSEIFWSEFNLYEKKQDHWQIQKNGLSIPIKDRGVNKTTPSFLVKLESGLSKTIYFKGKTVASHIGELSLYTEEEFNRSDRLTKLDFFNLYTAILLLMFIFVAAIYYRVREKAYFYYLAYVLSFAVWISVQSGLYLVLELDGWSDAVHFFGAVAVFFLILFSRHLLELDKRAPIFKMTFDFSAWIIALCAISIYLEVSYANLFLNIYVSLFFTGLLVVAIIASVENYFHLVRYYLVAILIYMPTMAFMTLTYNGFLSNNDSTRYAFLFGSFIEIAVFSFILYKQYQVKQTTSFK